MNNRNILVLSYEEAQSFDPQPYGITAIIRISSRDFKPLKYKEKFFAILELNFLDITEEEFYNFTPEEIEKLKENCPNPYPISTYQAEQILRFIEKYLDKINTLVIHCDNWESRSPAVAYIIAKYFLKDKNLSDKLLKEYRPNKTVISRLEELLKNNKL
ncbi:hypothetical protein [Persephonella sp.]